MSNIFDNRQSKQRSNLPFITGASGSLTNAVFSAIDPELSKLFEDRNVLLTQGGLITFTGTTVEFTEALALEINSQVAGGSPTVISLAATTRTISATGKMIYAVIDRSLGTAVVTDDASTLPAVTNANQEVFLIAKRVDAADGTKRLYFRNGMALNEGQTARLGASGSGSGGQAGSDLDSLLFRASFIDGFEEGPAAATSAVDSTANMTDATTYSAAKAMYQLSYDASKTIAVSTTTTNIELSAVASFTVKIGDIVISGSEAKRITAVASQSSFTTEAFSVAPTLASQVTVSQTVYTKDVYNLTVDGAAISEAFGAETFSEILVDYEDTTTVGDNIFNPNIAPVIAYSASQDGATFGDLSFRVTDETDTATSYFLPAAGIALYMRFFAYKQSGSGSVNILGYKSFMQKLPAAQAGGIINASYAFTNGVGTPVNCSLSVVGGKTVATLTYQYALGVNSGLPIGSIEVYLNGQLVPRFINATLTPDASYTEYSTTAIQLDKDYSSLNVSLEVIQRFQIIDASTVNTSNISYLQEINQNGFQAFVNTANQINATTTTGSPVAGTFYSTIVGRASITDLTQDLKARMGIERLMTQSIYQLQNEFGPNGEPVWATPNDSVGQIRFVGNWTSGVGTDGQRPISNSQNDFVEITFYGTGINLLSLHSATARSVVYSVDGGSNSANFIPNSANPTNSRNYNSNTLFGLSTGLTLGVHTIKITNTAAANDFNCSGFEILNESSSVKVNPGVSYVNGKKLALASQSSVSYSTGVTGVRGGRMLVYQASDGTVNRAFQAAGSQANLTSADHTNEEMVRQIDFREFGAGRADDFSSLVSSTSARAFTLDDGTTTLVTNAANVATAVGLIEYLSITNGNFLTLTFVGTGLDIFLVGYTSGTADTCTVQIDGGSSIGTITPSSNANTVVKLVSGLPYGTHTVKITRTTGTGFWAMRNFKVYQPKKPTLPSGATELADYNVTADFVANATSGATTIGTGLLRKNSSREMVYVGTWSIALDTTGLSGQFIHTATTTSYVQYTFFGTGFDWRWTNNSTSATWQMTLDGSTNVSAFTTSSYGTGVSSFTPATGTLVTSTTSTTDNGVRVSGLTLGLHTIKITMTAGTGDLTHEALDIITPIHSTKSNLYSDLQNTLTVGSNAISDNRKTTPVKDILPVTKAWAQAVGVTSNPTTTSTTAVPMPDMSVTIKTSGGALNISYSASVQNSGTSAGIFMQIYVDGQFIGSRRSMTSPVASFPECLSDVSFVPVSAGVHKVDAYWFTQSGTATAANLERTLVVREI